VSDTAYDSIIAAARKQFGQDGYRDVTIRSIAAEAGYSASMVMKLMGSKEQLFWRVAPGVASATGLELERELLPKGEIGWELVRRIFARRRLGSGDPYATAPLLVRSAPEPEQIRGEIWDRYVHNMAAMIGDSTRDSRHAKAVVSLLMGVATAVHTMDAYQADEDDEATAAYAQLVQTVIDRCDGPRAPLPDESIGIHAGNRMPDESIGIHAGHRSTQRED
jgi:AcrR family transcriptional regulator